MKSVFSSVVLSAAALLAAAGCTTNQPAQCSGQCACVAPAGASTAVNQQTADALRAALEDERRAEDFYGKVIARYGQVRPFTNIIHAEERHAQVIVTLMERHGVDVPDSPPTGVPAVPGTLAECNRVAAQAERDNIALYDRLLKVVTDPDIRKAFENLRAMSLNNHLPAFERWAAAAGPSSSGTTFARGYGRGPGNGICAAYGGTCVTAP